MDLLKNKSALSIFILVVLYTVGVCGIGSGYFPTLIYLTPLNLLISLALVLWNHPQWSRATIGFLLLCFVVGLSIEIVGVQSGLIFGEYQYGPVLGWKIWDTPVMIGINWMLLAYCTGASVNQMLPTWHWLGQALLGATLMVCLDIFIEPVAIYHQMWNWGGGPIPLQNYFAWFVISLFLLSVFHYFQAWIQNKVAYYMLTIQFLFFWILGFLIKIS